MDLNLEEIIRCFREYTHFATGIVPSAKEVLLNIEAKEKDPLFTGDMEALLRPGVNYDQEAAFEWLKSEVISKI